MLDIQLLRKDLPAAVAGLKRRGFEFDEAGFRSLEDERKRVQSRTEELQGRLKSLSKQIGMLKGQGKHDEAAAVMNEVGGLGDEVKANEAVLGGVQEKMNAFLRVIPNIPRADVPDGRSADDNVEVRRWGEPRKFDFTPKDHVDVGVGLGGVDFDTAAKLSGARFLVLRGAVARLHRALAQFMLSVHTEEHGYTEVYVPYMVTSECADGVSSLAKFKDDLFKIEGRDLYLIPTSEYPVTNFVRESIVDAKDLPLRFTCHSPCFRSEAGSYGKDTRGAIRNHQFDKVELVQIVRPDQSAAAHEQLTLHAEEILKRLELPYRTMLLCTGDVGFSSARTYDLEVWLPAQNAYREISSCSNFEAFQARRMQARYRSEQGKVEPLHTLNGSGLAVGRTLVAVVENYQNADGSVTVPKALVPFMGGLEKLGPRAIAARAAPGVTTRFIVVRHGETEWNVAKRIQGQTDSNLTAAGLAQAEAIGKRLARERFDVLVASDLGRTMRTAERIAAHGGPAVVADARLRERSFGEGEGLTYDEVDRRWPGVFSRADNTDPDATIPAGETRRQFHERVRLAFEGLSREHPGKRVAAVTHGGVLAVLYRIVHDIPLAHAHKITISNASYNAVAFDGDAWALEAWDDTAHLPDATPFVES